MANRKRGPIPASAKVSEMARAMGSDAFGEYYRLRDSYKDKGLQPREAVERACKELRILERYEDWRARRTISEMLDSQVPMTPMEVRKVIPDYRAPSVTKAELVGNEEMSFAEQVTWAQKRAARVQNGEPAPTEFPNEGALFWFQAAVANRADFQKVVERVGKPVSEGDNAYMVDGQYQMKELTSQLKSALLESGERIFEYEKGFVELLKQHEVASTCD